MENITIEQPKATFAQSTASGIAGFIKGALSGGLVGAIGGAVVGAVIGVVTGGLALPVIGAAALDGIIIGAAAMGGVGALAGTTTGVVQSREKNQVTAQDVVNVATISYAQGMGVGHTIGKEQAAQEAQTHFRDKILKERAARAHTQQQMH
ncbi:MAG: hypothetical protein AB7L92_06285 [Alphaproteobacteria bacterium]